MLGCDDPRFVDHGITLEDTFTNREVLATETGESVPAWKRAAVRQHVTIASREHELERLAHVARKRRTTVRRARQGVQACRHDAQVTGGRCDQLGHPGLRLECESRPDSQRDCTQPNRQTTPSRRDHRRLPRKFLESAHGSFERATRRDCQLLKKVFCRCWERGGAAVSSVSRHASSQRNLRDIREELWRAGGGTYNRPWISGVGRRIIHQRRPTGACHPHPVEQQGWQGAFAGGDEAFSRKRQQPLAHVLPRCRPMQRICQWLAADG